MKILFSKYALIITVFVLLAACLLSCVFWFQSSWLSQPGIDHLSNDQLKNDWKAIDKPLFPPQPSWGNFEFHAMLSSRLKWNAVYEGYSGGGQLGKLEQEVPFLVYFIECQRDNAEGNQIGSLHLHEEILVFADDIKAVLVFDSLDAVSLRNIEEKIGKGNYIEFNISFSYQRYSYHIHGIFPMAGSEFSVNDSTVVEVSRIIIQYVNDMVYPASTGRR